MPVYWLDLGRHLYSIRKEKRSMSVTEVHAMITSTFLLNDHPEEITVGFVRSTIVPQLVQVFYLFAFVFFVRSRHINNTFTKKIVSGGGS